MFAWLILIILFALWLFKNNSGKIPGPWFLPLAGSAPFIMIHEPAMLSYPYRAMYKLSKQYGNVMKVGLGLQQWIILSGFKEIQQFSMSEDSVSHLPSKTFDEIYSFDRPLGIIFPDGDLWREQRKFGVKTLRQLGVGKSSLEDKMVDETKNMIQYLKSIISTKGNLVEMDDFFDLPCLNIIWGLVNSTRFDYEDEKLKRQIQMIDKFTMESAIGPLVAMRPLRFIPPFSFIYNNVKNSMDLFKGYMRNLVSQDSESYDENEMRGYIDYFLHERYKESSKNYEDEQLIVTLIDFFTGGSGTMSKTLAFGILFSTLHPQITKQVQDEISNAGLDFVTLEDKHLLPYTEATVFEISRLASVLPIAPPRQTTGDIIVGEHLIPKGSLVQMNLYAMHRNSEHWTEPHKFRPERFLDSEGKFKQDEWVQPFGYGKRKCLGENVARNNTFLMYANMIRSFEFSVSSCHPLPSTDPVGGLTIGPQKFSVLVEPRN